MVTHLDIGDARYARAAERVLRLYDNFEAEANITSAVRDFLILTGLARADEMVEENPPSDGSRRAVDLTALDTFIEVKRRIGTASGFEPNPEYVRQLDDYLAESERAGRGVRMGILTDGRRWLLRWPGAGEPRTVYPYAFTLESAEGWLPLFEWLRDRALESREDAPVDRGIVEASFGPESGRYNRDITRLRDLYDRYADMETIRVKRRLWRDLLRAALGEIADSRQDADDLFIRHTYLTTVIGMVVQASFGVDITRLAETDPEDLLKGRELQNATGLQGVVESDFFAWPSEVGGLPLLRAIARRVARFDWKSAPADIAPILYESVIPADERRQLGEYYTPDWLARAMVEELVADPLNQRVLDPACGSGTFIVEAVRRVIESAREGGLRSEEVFDKLRDSVIGIDVHPVAVHLARASWALAARTAIQDAPSVSISAPIYLGDALQLRFRAGDMFAEHEVTIEVGDERNSTLAFPVSLVERANDFDSLMGDVADAIERGDDPYIALDDNGISDGREREVLRRTIGTMRRLHSEGRDHIWAYYTRNLVRPVALSRAKVDVIIGNPPWLNYRNTAATLRTELERQSRDVYGIWVGGRNASNQDVAGLFFARSVDLYLKDNGIIGMVMPHSALRTGQYRKWRTGRWASRRATRTLSVDFGYKTAWDLERLEPNTFFPVPSSAVFARRTGEVGKAVSLPDHIERWFGMAGDPNIQRARVHITDTSELPDSHYSEFAREGATVRPTRLFFVEETQNRAIIQAGQTITVKPRLGSQDKAPWKNLDLSTISEQTIESSHVYDIHLGETVVPYATLPPLKAVLPVRRGEDTIPADTDGVGGIRLGGLDRRMRQRWQTVSRIWEDNKSRANRLNLLDQLDYFGKLSAQFTWKRNTQARPIRLVYSKSGTPTAALVHDDNAIIGYTLYWVTCKSIDEANYLIAIVNSEQLAEDVNKYTTPNWSGNTRDLVKFLWKLPIPEYDANNSLHTSISDAGRKASEGAATRLSELYEERDRVTVTIARRELRSWLRGSDAGREVEGVVSELLSS